MKKTILLSTIAILLTACASKPNSHTEAPQVIMSKNLSKNQRDHILSKSNNLNLTWQKFREPLLMKLIKDSQDSNFSLSKSQRTLNQYYKSNPQFQSRWELELEKNNGLSDNYWHELRPILSAEITREYLKYYASLSQLNILLESNIILVDKPEKIDSLKEYISLHLDNLVTLTSKSKKELENELNSNFNFTAQKIMQNRIIEQKEFSVHGETLELRPDIFQAIIEAQNSLFRIANKNGVPKISLDGFISNNDNQIQIKIHFTNKNNDSLEIKAEDISEIKNKLSLQVEKVTNEVLLLVNQTSADYQNFQDNYTYYSNALNNLKSAENDKNKYQQDFYLATLDMIRAQAKLYDSLLNLYKTVELK